MLRSVCPDCGYNPPPSALVAPEPHCPRCGAPLFDVKKKSGPKKLTLLPEGEYDAGSEVPPAQLVGPETSSEGAPQIAPELPPEASKKRSGRTSKPKGAKRHDRDYDLPGNSVGGVIDLIGEALGPVPTEAEIRAEAEREAEREAQADREIEAERSVYPQHSPEANATRSKTLLHNSEVRRKAMREYFEENWKVFADAVLDVAQDEMAKPSERISAIRTGLEYAFGRPATEDAPKAQGRPEIKMSGIPTLQDIQTMFPTPPPPPRSVVDKESYS